MGNPPNTTAWHVTSTTMICQRTDRVDPLLGKTLRGLYGFNRREAFSRNHDPTRRINGGLK